MKRTRHDWAAIEEEYRAGQKTIRAIAEQHGLSDTAIRKRAKQDGWMRDLSDKVRREVRTKLVREQVRTDATDEEIIEAAAGTGAGIIQQHRSRIAKASGLADKMLTELESATGDVDISKRATTLRTLADTIERVVKLERQAYSLDEQGGPDPDVLPDALSATEKARRIAFLLSQGVKQDDKAD